jgi:hypothetical protein
MLADIFDGQLVPSFAGRRAETGPEGATSWNPWNRKKRGTNQRDGRSSTAYIVGGN